MGAYEDTHKRATICWDCARAIGDCSWSDYEHQSPVKGWAAEKTRVKSTHSQYVDSYCVISCPEFVRDTPRKKRSY